MKKERKKGVFWRRWAGVVWQELSKTLARVAAKWGEVGRSGAMGVFWEDRAESKNEGRLEREIVKKTSKRFRNGAFRVK